MNDTNAAVATRGWSRSAIVTATFVVVLLIGAGVGVLWWRAENDFCARVQKLPNATASVASSGTPAQSVLAYANQLDAVAAAAPNASTAAAARQIAAAERAVGQALLADPSSPATVSAIAAASSPQVVAAQATLAAQIDKSC